MGFLKRNWEKITSDTISGVLIKLAVLVLLGVGGYIGIKFVVQPVDSGTTKELIGLIRHIVFVVYCFLLFKLSDILFWSSEKRKDKIKEQELGNENLKLKNENLKLELELQRQKQQSLTDDEE
jgi:Ni,Fe-hydrogenase I cytochrome b subunit